MALLEIRRFLTRMVAAMLLFFAFATPVLSEIGCAEESVSHLQGGASPAASDDCVVADAGASPAPENRGLGGHCAFNHGHCAGIPITSKEADVPAPPAVAYQMSVARPLAALSLDTPERPPTA